MNLFILGVHLLLTVVTPHSAEIFELNGLECGLSENPHLIVNGTVASPGQFPWVVHVRVYINQTHFLGCGGTIITKRHVLTAAHCLRIEPAKVIKVEVLYGNNDFTKATKVDVEKWRPHERYSNSPHANDIAILVVKTPFQFSDTVKPACLPPAKLEVRFRRAATAGWGRIAAGGPATNLLQYTTLTIMPDFLCWAFYRDNYTIGSMLCTHDSASSACMGDSGGPLFLKVKADRFVQIGITSYGSPFCARLPSVFARVDAFMPWIKKNIGNHKAYEDISPYMSPMVTAPPLIEPYAFSSESTADELPEPYSAW